MKAEENVKMFGGIRGLLRNSSFVLGLIVATNLFQSGTAFWRGELAGAVAWGVFAGGMVVIGARRLRAAQI